MLWPISNHFVEPLAESLVMRSCMQTGVVQQRYTGEGLCCAYIRYGINEEARSPMRRQAFWNQW